MVVNYENRGLMTDYYELTMAQGYYDAGTANDIATFELFYRSNPFDGGYVVACGIYDAIKFIKNYKFTDEDIEYLRSKDDFSEDFLDFLSNLEFDGTVEGVLEGSIVFPYEPILSVTGPIALIQLIESGLLNIINFQSLVATKASRVVLATDRKNTVLEFGLRRAHGDGAHVGARAAIIGGCVGTSNTYTGKLYNLPVSGTQAHSWIQSFDTELEAFRNYAETFPKNTILLVDTYDTLESGVPNAITVAKEMEEKGEKLRGIRIDSGDLAWLSIQSAKMLDDAGFEDVKIVLSGDLDEYVIESIVRQISTKLKGNNDGFRERLIDRLLWGVGTNLITGSGGKKAALGGVYKLVEKDGKPVIKISENRAKTTNPGRKRLWRIKNVEGDWLADVMTLQDEDKPANGDTIFHYEDPTKFFTLQNVQVEPLFHDLMTYYQPSHNEEDVWTEAKDRLSDQLDNGVDPSHTRFLNPHIYRVSLSEKLFNLKQEFIQKHE